MSFPRLSRPCRWPRRQGTGSCWLHHKAPCCNDNEAPQGGFGRPQHPQHGAMDGTWNPRNRPVTFKPQQDEKVFNYPLERFAVAFDGQVPVHIVPIPAERT